MYEKLLKIWESQKETISLLRSMGLKDYEVDESSVLTTIAGCEYRKGEITIEQFENIMNLKHEFLLNLAAKEG